MNESQARTGRSDLKDFGGAAPLPKADEVDQVTTPPVDDEPRPAPASGARDDVTGRDNGEAPRRQDGEDDAPKFKGPPADDARSKIYAKFDQKRDAQARGEPVTGEGDGAELGDPDPGEGEKDEAAKAPDTPPGPSDSGDKAKDSPAEKPMTLTVLGKTLTKTLEEVAALSELSIDEVKADPARAVRYAQRELATQARLNEANELRRSAKPAPAPTDDADRTARPAPNQEQQPSGNDDNGQPKPDRKTTGAVDFAKLAEAIQIEDPKEAGQKIKEAFETIAKEVTVEAVSETEQQRRAMADSTTARSSMTKFVEAHPEVQGNKFMASAIATALIDEYRDDLISAMTAEGSVADRSEAESLIAQATPDQIAQAHKGRRMRGDPNVRSIDVGFFEKAYSRVTQSLGVPSGQPKQQHQQEGLQGRKEAKRSLPHQPQRASVPPVTPPASAKPPSRAEVVQEMRRARGQKPAHAR